VLDDIGKIAGVIGVAIVHAPFPGDRPAVRAGAYEIF
jgi:hypothetical protein